MRQKLALVAAMQHDPQVLILDEPTDGLDPLIQRNFEEVIRAIHARGRTVFMSSHDLPEVERLCQTVAIVRGGRLLTEATIADLQRRHGGRPSSSSARCPRFDLSTIAGVRHLAGGWPPSRAGYRGRNCPPAARRWRHSTSSICSCRRPAWRTSFLGFYGRRSGRSGRPVSAGCSGAAGPGWGDPLSAVWRMTGRSLARGLAGIVAL
jgi:energy-coupling factor transporter ATP-binding protein EcfA2